MFTVFIETNPHISGPIHLTPCSRVNCAHTTYYICLEKTASVYSNVTNYTESQLKLFLESKAKKHDISSV